MNLRLCSPKAAAWIAIGFFQLFALSTKAQDNDLVEVRSKDDILYSYQARRNDHGWQFALSYENYAPKEYVSNIDSAAYGDMFGSSSVALMGFEVGYKYNFSAGSLSALAGYGGGNLKGDSLGETRSLTVTRPTLRAMYIMDNFMPEPYVAPYAAFGIASLSLDEKIIDSDSSLSGKARMAMMMTVGVLLQTNWIEDDVSKHSYQDIGLQNTYVDLFLTQYTNTAADGEPLADSSFNWGAGLRLEF